MGRRKKPINNTQIPQHKVEAIARCIMPDILALYESEEGQKELAGRKRQQEAERSGAERKGLMFKGGGIVMIPPPLFCADSLFPVV